MKLVTVATHSEGYFPWLLKSCERHGAQLDVLGWGQKWQGYAWRLTLMIKYLKKQHPQEVVCFIDGFDVILLKPLEELEARFLKLKEQYDFQIAVGKEIALFKVLQWCAQLLFGKCKSVFINAGCYVGLAKDLLSVIQNIYHINPHFNADDQQMLLTYCRENPKNVYIDEDRHMFLNLLYPFNDINKRIASFLENDPCIYHGAANTNMNNLIRALGYNMSEREEAVVNAYHWNTQMRKGVYYSGLLIPLIVGLLIALILFIALLVRFSSRS